MKVYSTTFNYTPSFKGSKNTTSQPNPDSVVGFGKFAFQVPISMGWRSIFGSFGDNKYDTLSKKYPEETMILDSAKSVDATGCECERFNKQGKCDILERINIAKNNGRDCKKILKTMLDQKEYGNNFSLIQRFSKNDICNVLDVYANENPKLVDKIIKTENSDKYAESLYQFESGDIKNVINIINRNSYLADEIINTKHVPKKMGLSSLAADINGEKLRPEQINIALELMNTKNKNGNKILEDDWQFDDAAKTTILNTEKRDLPIIIDLCKNSNLSFAVSANLAKGLSDKKPEQLETIKTLLSKDIKIDNYAQTEKFLNMPEAKQEKIITEIDKNQEFVSNNDINVAALDDELSAKINYMKNERYFVAIADQYRDLMFSEDNVPLGAVKNGIALAKLVPEELTRSNDFALNNAFALGIYNKLGYISDTFTNEYMKTLKKLPNFDGDSIERFSNVFIYNFEDICARGDIGTLSKNIDYFRNKDLSGYSYQQLENILFSKNENLKANKEKLDNILTEDEDKIINALRNKCSNIPPDYGENVIAMLEREKDYEQLIFMPKISKEEIINNAIKTEKLIYVVIDNPKKYLNGNYSGKVLSVVSSDLKHIPILNKTYISTEEGFQIDEAKESINDNIYDNLPRIITAIAITDGETVRALLNKKLLDFSEEINNMQKLSPESKKLLSDIIKNGRSINRGGFIDKLSVEEKLDMLNMVKFKEIFDNSNQEKMNFNKYFNKFSESEFIIDIDSMHEDVLKNILINYGMTKEEFSELKPEYLKWDLSNIGTLCNSVSKNSGEIGTVLREASLGNYENFINSPENKYGIANIKTKKIFEKNNLNFNNWDNSIEPKEFSAGGQILSINKWSRTPQKSLMDGAYTDCGNTIDKMHCGTMADYLLNKAINVFEVKNEKGNIVGMSVCFVGEVNGKQSLIIENMEVNKNFARSLIQNHAEKEYTENVTDYIQNFADSIGGLHMPVYMSSGNMRFDDDVLKDYQKINAHISLTGEIAKNKIYMNTFKNEVNPKTISSRNTELYTIRD